MTALDPQELLGSAQDIVAQGLHHDADQCEAFLTRSASLDIDIEADKVSGANLSHDGGGSVRVVKDGRLGFAFFTRIDDAATAIQSALDMARLAPRLGYELPSARPVASDDRWWNDELAQLDVEGAARAARETLAAAKDRLPDAIVAGGGVGVGWTVSAIASSEGAATVQRGSSMSNGLSLSLPHGDSAISAWDSKTAHEEVDGVAVAQRLCQTVDDLRDPEPASSATADVVFLPGVLAQMLDAVVYPAVDGDAACRNKSVWSDSVDEAVAHEGLHLVDDPLREDAVQGALVDGEGRAVERFPLIEAGVLRGFIFDSWDAHRHKRHGTAHARRGDFRGQPGTGLHHPVLEHDTTLPFDRLLGDIDDGYLVESVLGAHTANATTGDFSVSAPNVWRIENGARTHACQAIALGGNFPELLGRLDAVDDAPRAFGGTRLPAARIRDVQVSA